VTKQTERLFFQLLRAGLWGIGNDAPTESFDGADWDSICLMAKEQTVAGIIGDGVAAFKSKGLIKEMESETRNFFIRQSFNIEKKNEAIDLLLSQKTAELEAKGIRPVVMKGQGTARCYPAPSHRTCGDIDYLLSKVDYDKAVETLKPQADRLETEYSTIKHFGMHFGKNEIELHGTLSCGFGKKFDSVLDKMQDRMFAENDFRIIDVNGTPVRLPSANFDAVYIFAHFMKHFYQEGLGLRQVCDWTMLLHSAKDSIDRDLLEQRIEGIGMMKEWKAFGSLAVDWLGLPAQEMPFFDPTFSKHVQGIWNLMLLSGNFGQKIAAKRGIAESSGLSKKWKKFSTRARWTARHFTFNPSNTMRSLGGRLRESLLNIRRGQL